MAQHVYSPIKSIKRPRINRIYLASSLISSMTNIENLSVNYGDLLEFKKIIAALSYIQPEKYSQCVIAFEIINFSDFSKIIVVDHEFKLLPFTRLILQTHVNKFQPTGDLPKTLVPGKYVYIVNITKKDVYTYFPLARERISIIKWLKETFEKHEIDIFLLNSMLKEIQLYAN